jgi:hypothetical protein
MAGKPHTSRRGYWFILVLFGVITLVGMESLHWSFLRTEEVSIGGVLICLAIELYHRRR